MKGGGSHICGKNIFVLTDVEFQAVWRARETRSAIGKQTFLASKNHVLLALFGQFTYKDLIYIIDLYRATGEAVEFLGV